MPILLIQLFFCFLTPSPLVKSNIVYKNNIIVLADEEESTNTTLENSLLGGGLGLVAVGGIGAGIITHNNNKPKDVPSKEIKSTYDENDEEKID